MNIVIIGGGTVGAAICAELSAEKHNITIVDGNAAAVEEIASTCDVFGVVGNGADVSVLRKAGTEKAEFLSLRCRCCSSPLRALDSRPTLPRCSPASITLVPALPR